MQNVPYRILIMDIICYNPVHADKVSLIENPEGFSISRLAALYQISFIH